MGPAMPQCDGKIETRALQNKYSAPTMPTTSTTAEIVTQNPSRSSMIARGMRFYLLAFLLNRYGLQARAIIEERLGFWVTLAAVLLVVGIVAALYLF